MAQITPTLILAITAILAGVKAAPPAAPVPAQTVPAMLNASPAGAAETASAARPVAKAAAGKVKPRRLSRCGELLHGPRYSLLGHILIDAQSLADGSQVPSFEEP